MGQSGGWHRPCPHLNDNQLCQIMEARQTLFRAGATPPMLTRMFDILIGIIGCVIMVLMLPVIALLIKIDSKGPVFYRQRRTAIQNV